jgi:PAS domain S-box-containing protein
MLQELVVVTDAQGVIVYANKATEQVTGYPLDEVVGSTPTLWRLDGHKGSDPDVWGTVVSEKQPYHSTVRNVRSDGTMYDAAVQVAPVVEADGTVRFCLYVERDTTDADALERIQRRVIALTSHNLKTPLASVRWQAEMLRDGEMGRVSKDQRESIEEMLDGVTRTIGMVEQWLTVTHLDMGDYTPNNESLVLNAIVEDVLAGLQPRIEQEGVTVHSTPDPSPCSIVIDADSIRTIVHTLIFNAVKYNRDEGTVDVDVVTLAPEQDFAGKSFPETRAVLSVRDTGLGIPTDEQEQVFRECYHGSNSGAMKAGGSGLGLYIAGKLVRALQGDIWFSSSEQGSHFIVAIPCSKTAT